MASKNFLNLAVKDRTKPIAFFTQLGFYFDPQFTDEQATRMIVGENIFTMLLTEQHFGDFTKKEICNAHKNTEILITIDVESRKKVDEIVQKVLISGGSKYKEPQDHGWMYTHSFVDLDEHQWKIMYDG